VFGAFVFRSRSGEQYVIRPAVERLEAETTVGGEPLSLAEARWALRALSPTDHLPNQELRRFWRHHDERVDLCRMSDHQLFQALLREVARVGGLQVVRLGGGLWDGGSRGSRAAEAAAGEVVERIMGRAKILSFRGGHYVFATASNRHQRHHKILPREEAQRLALSMIADFPRQKAALEEAGPLLGKSLFLLQYSPPVFHPTSAESSTPSQAARQPAKDTDWIEVLIQDKEGRPYRGPVEVVASDGRRFTSATDDTGLVRLDGLPPGQCQLSLPALDASSW
jgi:hypothetical protein